MRALIVGREVASIKTLPGRAVMAVRRAQQHPPTSPHCGRATVELLRISAQARARRRPRAQARRHRGLRRRVATIAALAVMFVLAPSAIWLVAMFAVCVTLAQGGWLPPVFLRGPWAPPPCCTCHEHGALKLRAADVDVSPERLGDEEVSVELAEEILERAARVWSREHG